MTKKYLRLFLVYFFCFFSFICYANESATWVSSATSYEPQSVIEKLKLDIVGLKAVFSIRIGASSLRSRFKTINEQLSKNLGEFIDVDSDLICCRERDKHYFLQDRINALKSDIENYDHILFIRDIDSYSGVGSSSLLKVEVLLYDIQSRKIEWGAVFSKSFDWFGDDKAVAFAHSIEQEMVRVGILKNMPSNIERRLN